MTAPSNEVSTRVVGLCVLSAVCFINDGIRKLEAVNYVVLLGIFTPHSATSVPIRLGATSFGKIEEMVVEHVHSDALLLVFSARMLSILLRFSILGPPETLNYLTLKMYVCTDKVTAGFVLLCTA